MWQRLKNIYHLIQSISANYWYGFPSKKLTVIGVTGTDGKTTTTSIIYHILHEAGYNTSMITSIGAFIGGKNHDIGFHVTNPSAWPLQRFFKTAAKQGSTNEKKYMVLETTSHGIDQYRVWGVNYKIGVITNVTKEHLDYHKTYDHYVKTKVMLIKMSNVGVVNRDDQSYDWIVSELARESHKQKIITYGIYNKADVTPKSFQYISNLIGEFNDYNILAAITVCQELGVPDDNIRLAIKSFKAPVGREQIIYKKDFTVMIDFAHTSNSIHELLKALRVKAKGKIIHVFGSAGERDHEKRPEMGRYSSEYADVIILTAEDPRSEDVSEINAQIASGIKNVKTNEGRTVEVLKIPDRKKAIERAIELAKKDDFVVLTGKAHEKSMNMGRGEEPWDEFSVAYEALKKRNASFNQKK